MKHIQELMGTEILIEKRAATESRNLRGFTFVYDQDECDKYLVSITNVHVDALQHPRPYINHYFWHMVSPDDRARIAAFKADGIEVAP